MKEKFFGIFIILMLLITVATTAFPSSNIYNINNNENNDKGNKIFFKTSTFNPIVENPSFRECLIIQENESQYFIVQLDGPIYKSEIETLKVTGAKPIEYIPEYAYIVNFDTYKLDFYEGSDLTSSFDFDKLPKEEDDWGME